MSKVEILGGIGSQILHAQSVLLITNAQKHAYS